MEDKTMAVTKDWKKKQKLDYSVLGFNTMQPKQLVFSNEHNEYLQPTKTRKWILHVQSKYNLGAFTPHGLRHTHCSLLFEAGASIKEVLERLGHTDVKTIMDIYTHVTQKNQS
ncbi:tyrosine-type recombinase/integrase [Lysinibacillus fusiformis]|uniref:tyrosine-type recombinase/integrase n=1 Tax=Lysinibacillus fusiformis TaxID=28031 RepID=UPI003D066DEA